MGLLKKAKKAVSKAVKNVVKSTGKAVENTVSAGAKLVTGDVSGAVDKALDATKNYVNTTTLGTVDVTGRNDGAVVNVDADKYADKANEALKKAADAVTGNGQSKTVTKNPDYSEYNNKNKAEKERKDAAADNRRAEVAKKKNALQYKVFVKGHADDLKNILGIKG